MEIEQIEVDIDPNGDVHIHVRGIKGRRCIDVTKNLEGALGGDIIKREMTTEADEEEGTQGSGSCVHH